MKLMLHGAQAEFKKRLQAMNCGLE